MEKFIVNSESEKHALDFLEKAKARGFSVTGGAKRFKKFYVNNEPDHLSIGGLDPRNEGIFEEFLYPEEAEEVWKMVLSREREERNNTSNTSKYTSMNLTTPEEFNEISETALNNLIEEVEDQLQKNKESMKRMGAGFDGQVSISISGSHSKRLIDRVVRAYKEAGWDDVKGETTNTPRGTLTTFKFIKS